nr:hypothetical protein [Pleurocapsa sp. MO_192.B19]
MTLQLHKAIALLKIFTLERINLTIILIITLILHYKDEVLLVNLPVISMVRNSCLLKAIENFSQAIAI